MQIVVRDHHVETLVRALADAHAVACQRARKARQVGPAIDLDLEVGHLESLIRQVTAQRAG